MAMPFRRLAGFAAVGAVALAAAIVPILTAPLAAEPTARSLLDDLAPPGHAFDPGKLVRLGDNYFAIAIEPSVSGEVDDRHTIRKIAFGRTSFVDVVTTPTGTYSSDAIGSPNVLYPGVHVERLDVAPFDDQGLYGWSSSDGWTPLTLVDAHSFSVITGGPDTVVTTDRHGTCVVTPGVKACV